MSTDSLNPGFGVTADDIRSYDWQAVVAGLPSRECQAYCGALGKQAVALKDAGDDRGNRVFQLLTAVASYCPNYGDNAAPYRPWQFLNGNRSAIPEDLTPSDLAALTEIVAEIRDAEFRARVADVIWISPPKNYKAAQMAVDAYVESARTLETGEFWFPSFEHLYRARQIGAQIGRLQSFHQKAIQAIEETITRYEATEVTLRCWQLMHMLLADGVGDPTRYAQLSERLALKMEAISNWKFAQAYWQLYGGWSAKEGKQEEARGAQLKIANTYIKLAESFATGTQQSYLTASHWMAKAVHSLREAKADPVEIEKAHQRLLDFQKRGMSEMQSIQIPREGSDLEEKLQQSAKAAAEFVKCHAFEDAILRLAYVSNTSRPTEIRKRIENNEGGGVFTQIFGASTVRPDGQISDTKPPLDSDDPKAREEALVKEMYRVAPVRLCDRFPARRLGSATTKRSGVSNEIEPVILVGY